MKFLLILVSALLLLAYQVDGQAQAASNSTGIVEFTLSQVGSIFGKLGTGAMDTLFYSGRAVVDNTIGPLGGLLNRLFQLVTRLFEFLQPLLNLVGYILSGIGWVVNFFSPSY